MKPSYKKIILILITTLLLSACSDKQSKKPHTILAPEVHVAKPLIKEVEIWDSFIGRIEGIESVDIKSRVGGYLDSIHFKKGQVVKEGDLLFTIDRRPYEASVDAAKAQVLSVQSRINLAENNVVRAKQLFEENAIAKEVLETRNSELASAKASMLEAKAKLREAELNLEFTQITSPISGTISETYIDVGNLINANSSSLASVVRTDIVKVYFDINEQDVVKYGKLGFFDKIKDVSIKEPSVEVNILNDDERVFKGYVSYYDNRVGRTTSSLILRADIENPKGELMAGMFAKIKLSESGKQEKILLPETAIGTDLVGRYVFIIDDNNIVKYSPIEVGKLIGKFRIINSGIDKNDRVIVVGIQRAVHGRKVTPKNVDLKD